MQYKEKISPILLILFSLGFNQIYSSDTVIKEKPKRYGQKIVKKTYEIEFSSGVELYLSSALKSASAAFTNQLLFLVQHKHSFTYAAKTIFSYGVHLDNFSIANENTSINTYLTGLAYSILYYTPDFGSLFAISRIYAGLSSNFYSTTIPELQSVGSGGAGGYIGLQYGLGGMITEEIDIKVLHRFYLLMFQDATIWSQNIMFAINYKI